jgi:hypothetical protein
MDPRVLLEKITLPQLVNEFLPIHGTQRFICLQKSFPFVPILRLGLQSGLLPSNFFSTNALHAYFFSLMYATCLVISTYSILPPK